MSLRPSQGVLQRRSASGLIVLPLAGAPSKLNATAALVWDLIRDGHTQPGIVTVVSGIYEQEATVVAPLIEGAIEQLISAGLAHREP